jgi:hypothetical protein
VGGTFTSAGGITANNIAVYKTDNKWYALTDSRTKLNGVNGTVRALTWSGGNLWVGGDFTYISDGLIPANRIARYSTNVDHWIPIIDVSDLNGVNGTVYALQLDSVGNLYAGGAFTGAGGTVATNIAYYDVGANTWSQLNDGSGEGVNGTVYALVWESGLYVGGTFTQVSTTTAGNVAKWSSGSWDTLSGGVDGGVKALAYSSDSSNLYIGGGFQSAGSPPISANYLVRYNPSNYIPMVYNNDLSNPVNALTYNSTTRLVYIGGIFTLASIGSSGPLIEIGRVLTFNDATPGNLVDTIPSSGTSPAPPLSVRANGISDSSWSSGTVYTVTTTTAGILIVIRSPADNATSP